eukprot:1136917-Amphidinium_carterae.1
MVGETNLLAAPFVVGSHQRVVEHATYAICLDCDSLTDTVRPAGPSKVQRKKRAKLEPGFAAPKAGADFEVSRPASIG